MRGSMRKNRVAIAALVVAAAFAVTAQAAVEPNAIEFPTEYGPVTFPEQFPDGTTLNITQWSHFVPRYDKWFDQYAQEWGQKNNVKVTVQHIALDELPPTLSAAIAAKKGSDLFEMVAPPAAFIEGLQDMKLVNEAAEATFGKAEEVCTSQAYLPVTDMWYGFCHGWVPDPGNYLISLWKDIGYENGPQTYEDLYEGGKKIFAEKGIPVAVGMSPELDSEFYARSLIWSFGGKVFDQCGEVALDSPEVIEAVKYQTKLFKDASTPEVFSWNPASNNQAFIAGQASYIQNSISYYRTAQKAGDNPTVPDTGLTPGLKGPGGEVHQTSHVWYIYVMPKYVSNDNTKQAAQKFLLNLATNSSRVTYESELYNFPAYSKQVPQLFEEGGWLDEDPFGSNPPDKLNVLRNAVEWTAWPGYPGASNPAVSEVYNTHLLVTMMAQAARGEKTPEQAVKDTAKQIGDIVAKWKDRGLIGCAK